MSNPLFNELGGNIGGMGGLISQFNQFKQNYKGNARQEVQNMLNSGRISQEQFNKASQMAQMMQRFMK